jgi:hypothetical protein
MKSITSSTPFNLHSLTNRAEAAAAAAFASSEGEGVVSNHPSSTPNSSPGVSRPRLSRGELVSILDEALSVDNSDEFRDTFTLYDLHRGLAHHHHHPGRSSSSDRSSAK